MQDINTAAIFELRQEGVETSVFVPIMATDNGTLMLTMEWASSLADHSGKQVTVFRNGAKLITIPVGN